MIQFACYILYPTRQPNSQTHVSQTSHIYISQKNKLPSFLEKPHRPSIFLLKSPHAPAVPLIYIHKMMDEKIKIRLPNAREKLQPLFPDDNRGDIKIQFGKKSFKLQKAFLRLESAFFKRTFSTTNQILEIKQDFNQTYFANILKCFYGFTIEIARSEILEYYPIIKFLEVQSLLKILREDMTTKSQCYDVFILLQIAHRFDQQQLFENCLAQLQKESYEQLRYAKHELLRCPMELFKMIIKTHNRLKSQKNKGIQFMEIDQIIKEFSEEKKLNQPQYQELKFQLIDKKSLSSQEYKEIFIVDAKKKGAEYRSMVKLSPDSGALYNSGFNNNLFSASKLTESVIEPIKKLNDEIALELQNTYEKKKNEELQAENAYLSNELKELKVKFGDHSSSLESLKEVVARLQARLDEKDRVDKQQTNIIKKLEKTCQQLRNDINSRNDIIKKLEDRISKLEKQPEKRMSGNPKYIPYDEEEDQSKTIQSQIVPGHLLKEIAKPAADALNPPANSGGFKKAKQPTPTVVAQAKIEEELDEDQIEEMYSSRLEFDREPVGCNKRLLPKLANFLTTDGFQKKKLRLVFRRTLNTSQPAIGSPTDIRNRNSLLFLICTRLNQVIGGFTSVQITKNSHDYLSDQNAFIFSLSKDQRFNIKKTQIHQAIFISPDYLFGFSNDIMINTDCLLPNSCECAWPDAYECNGSKRSPKWLTGQQSSFSLKSLQIYEVKEEEMIMDL